MDLMDPEDLNKKLCDTMMQITDLPWSGRKDCIKMGAVIQRMLSELSKESVECRRLKRITRKYEELNHRIQESLRDLEKHVLMANLMKR